LQLFTIAAPRRSAASLLANEEMTPQVDALSRSRPDNLRHVDGFHHGKSATAAFVSQAVDES
jgi:hypothetical protein